MYVVASLGPPRFTLRPQIQALCFQLEFSMEVDFSAASKCPECDNLLDRRLKLELLWRPSIRCPFCTRDLRVSESKAYMITFPIYCLFGLALFKYTDLTQTMAFIAISLFILLSYIPGRTIEIIATKLLLEEER